MFTLDQIKGTHAKVKSGADFPQYVQDVKALGMISYTQFVSDGHTVYNGNEQELVAPAKYEVLEVASTGNAPKLAADLKAHQAGQTDYPTFCRDAAAAGVEQWTVDVLRLTCTYYDKAGNSMLSEAIPEK
ncbi:MAG: DUF1398 family protein [Bacteroidota bacterium]